MLGLTQPKLSKMLRGSVPRHQRAQDDGLPGSTGARCQNRRWASREEDNGRPEVAA